MTIIELTDSVAHAPIRVSRDQGVDLRCSRTLGIAACREVDSYLQTHPEQLLRVYKKYESKWDFDLGFLAYLPSLRALWIQGDAGDLNDLAPLHVLPRGLTELTLDTIAMSSDKKRDRPKQNTHVLGALEALQSLAICGRLAHLDFLGPLQHLRKLDLWRCKLGSLGGIGIIEALEHLKLKASGVKVLEPLSDLPHLRSLEIWDQRNMIDLAPLAQLRSLERLWLLSCGATLALPSFASCTNLKVLVVDKLATRENLQLIASAPALRCLVLSGSPALHNVSALAALADHPALREVRIESFDDDLLTAIADRYGWKVSYSNLPADEHLD